jgi:hypothetical protein
VKDVQDMTEEEYRLYKVRRAAAGIFRRFGYAQYAEQVERGQLDGCMEMRLGAFFVDPPQPPDPEFIAAWDEFAAENGE